MMDRIPYHKMTSATVFVPTEGGDCEAVSPDGELRFRVALPPGVGGVDHLKRFMVSGDVLKLSEGVNAIVETEADGNRLKPMMSAVDLFSTGANQDPQFVGLSIEEHRANQMLKKAQRILTQATEVATSRPTGDVIDESTETPPASKPEDVKPDPEPKRPESDKEKVTEGEV